MKAFVISLERSRDRRRHMANQLSRVGLDYQIVEGVDGDLLDSGQIGRASSSWLGPNEFAPRILGCALSHAKARAAIVGAGLRSALILEDDVVLPPALTALAEEAARHTDRSEVVLFHLASYDPPGLLSRAGAVPLPNGHRLCYPVDLRNHWSGSAYLITAEACRRMVSTDLATRAAADEWALFQAEGLLDRVRCIAPLPITIKPRFDSTIGHMNSMEHWRDYLYRALEQIPVGAQPLVALRRRRLLRRLSALALVDEPPPDRL